MDMEYLTSYQDHGIVLRPDRPGEPFYAIDGGGVREAILNKVEDTYYLFYNGARPGAAPDSYWTACLAKSRDLLRWEKLGQALEAGVVENPRSQSLDTKTASSPWVFYADGKWYMYYVGADHCSPEGVPACPYYTLLATAEQITGPWHKANREPGKEKHVCFMTRPDSWMDFTASPGHVMENPHWKGPGDAENDRYLMFFSGACRPPMARSLGIASTNDLSCTDDCDSPRPNHWRLREEPILSPKIDIENSSIYYEEENGTYFLFTNHIKDNRYTDAVYVYCSKDPCRWDAECCKILVDASVSTWAHGAIGLATVTKADAHTLAVVYDGVEGDGQGHLDRKIGYGTLPLPLAPFCKE